MSIPPDQNASAPGGKPSFLARVTPRLLGCLVASVILVAAVALAAPQQIGVILYKACLLALAGYGGYWLDRTVFPYARPDSYLVDADWRTQTEPASDQANHPVVPGYEGVFSSAMLRRGVIMAGAILGLGLGL